MNQQPEKMNQDSRPFISSNMKKPSRSNLKSTEPTLPYRQPEDGRDTPFRFMTHNPRLSSHMYQDSSKIAHLSFLISTYINSKSLQTTILAAAPAATSYTNICHLQSSAPATTATSGLNAHT